MSEEIFRKKSLDKMKSPEELNDIIKVANPSVWILILGTMLILIGACIWGIFGTVDTTLAAVAAVSDGTASFFVSADTDIASVPETVIASLNGEEVTFARGAFSGKEQPTMGDGTLFIGSVSTELPSGVYPATITTERIHPVTFIMN